MTEGSTHPIEVEGADRAGHLWQDNQMAWTFGARQRIVGWADETKKTASGAPSANQRGPSTVGPQKIVPPEGQPVIVNNGGFGKRGFQPLFEWEGVVESAGASKFKCRIAPLNHGSSDGTKVELTDFSYDDLATDSDRALVVPGAIFYWTVGRARNVAGTITNLSLVRFRRLPPPTSAQASQAEKEALELLRVLGDGNGSVTPRK